MNTGEIVETERQLLSSLRHASIDVQRSVSEGLRADDFTLDLHRQIFAAICELSSHNDEIDEVSLGLKLKGAIGFPDLTALIQLESTSLHRRLLTSQIIDASRKRHVTAELARATGGLSAAADSWADTWAAVEPHLHAAQQIALNGRQIDKQAILAEARQLLGPVDQTGLIGPFPAWDRAARKLRSGELCVLAGRPGTGKSALALQFATACVKTGKRALIFSLEMSEAELLARLAIQRARTAHESQALAELERVANQEYEIVGSHAAHGMAQIEGRAKMDAATGKLGLVIIDYLQLITPSGDQKQTSREQQVSNMTRRCKLLAAEIKCPIILLAQLNRESEKEDRRPRLSDLRESGAIEQDADAVWLLHRENAEDASRTITVQLIQAKRRNWQPGIFIRLGFTGEIVTFTPLAETGAPKLL